MPITTDCRYLAADVVAGVITHRGSLATLLPAAQLRAREVDRPLLQELCYGTLRHHYSLAGRVRRCLEKPLREKDTDVFALLLLGAYQLLHTRIPPYAAVNSTVEATRALGKNWARGLVNAVLRKIQNHSQVSVQDTGDEECHYDHPQWLIDALRTAWPRQADELLLANNTRAPLTLRVNQRTYRREIYLQKLVDAGIDAELCSLSPVGIRLREALPVERLPEFAEGAVSVQDEAAQLCTDLLELRPHQRVLDACAAPGGKTGHLLEAVESLSLLATDVDAGRCELIRENLRRLRLRADVQTADAGDPRQWSGNPPSFDRILLDAPCSATGVIRHHPDIKLLRRESDIPALAAAQLRLLSTLWPVLAPGGILLYVTCSLLPRENDDVITSFLGTVEDAMVDALEVPWGMGTRHGRQLLTQADGHDGFYYARLRKITDA